MKKSYDMRWNQLDKIGFVLVLFIAFISATKHFMPRIEGAFFPVVSHATLLEATPKPPPDYRYEWSAWATKYRGGCDYIRGSITWYLGPKDGRRAEVGAVFIDPPQIRDAGILEWSGLQIDLNPVEVRKNSYATVRHQCPWRWWETESDYYLSE